MTKIRVLRLLEYTYDSIESYESDQKRWAIPANGTGPAPHASVTIKSATIKSATLPLETLQRDLGVADDPDLAERCLTCGIRADQHDNHVGSCNNYRAV